MDIYIRDVAKRDRLAIRMIMVVLLLAIFATNLGYAQGQVEGLYKVQPGDRLEVSVWKEEDLQRIVLVRPDGRFSFPLAGDIDASGRSVDQLREELANRLMKYIPEPTVTVTVQDIQGNVIYVMGQVKKPGAFVVNSRVDVIQALSLAGGTTPFAALSDIVILRRSDEGDQVAIRFKYKEVERGRNLDQNIILNSGDIVVVP